MEYQKFINLLYNTPNQLTKFTTKHWVEINYHWRGKYNDTNITPITDCINEINNTQVDNAKYIDAVLPIYNLIEYSNNYLKTSGSIWQYYRDEKYKKWNDNIENYESFQFMVKITKKKTPDVDNEKNVAIAVPLKYLSHFCKTLQLPLVDCETDLILT